MAHSELVTEIDRQCICVYNRVQPTSSRQVSPPAGDMSEQAMPTGAGAGANTGTEALGVSTGEAVTVGEAGTPVGAGVTVAVGKLVATGEPGATGVLTGKPAAK